RATRDGASGFKAEAGRYQLVTAPSCPWAHRSVLMRQLKRLENALPLLESDLPKGQGWAYSRGFDDLAPKDGVFHVHQVYSSAKPDYTGRATVPVLWDRETRTIVNNESPEIIRMLNSEFDEFGDASLDLYPEPLRRDIDEVNAFVYDNINNGVCRWARNWTSLRRTTALGCRPRLRRSALRRRRRRPPGCGRRAARQRRARAPVAAPDKTVGCRGCATSGR